MDSITTRHRAVGSRPGDFRVRKEGAAARIHFNHPPRAGREDKMLQVRPARLSKKAAEAGGVELREEGMSDEKLIMLIAGTWFANGGDSEGFAWSYQKILDAIRQLEAAENVSTEETAVEKIGQD